MLLSMQCPSHILTCLQYQSLGYSEVCFQGIQLVTGMKSYSLLDQVPTRHWIEVLPSSNIHDTLMLQEICNSHSNLSLIYSLLVPFETKIHHQQLFLLYGHYNGSIKHKHLNINNFLLTRHSPINIITQKSFSHQFSPNSNKQIKKSKNIRNIEPNVQKES